MKGKNNMRKKDLPTLKNSYSNKKKQENYLLKIGISIFLLCFLGISWTSYNILSWKFDNEKTEEQIKYLADLANINNSSPTTEVRTNSVNNNSENEINEELTPENISNEENTSSYLNVNFTELLAKNNDTKAFIKVEGTNITYPVVQSSDNDFYLTHSFNKTDNRAGWVFLDYRNDINDLQANTIIYAHGLTRGTMFGTLKNVLKKDWQENENNHIIRISTPSYNALWKVFSVYTIPTEVYYLTNEFNNISDHQKFLNTLIGRSIYNFGTTVNTDDKVLTLSTCLNDFDKVVLHAKLIAKEVR